MEIFDNEIWKDIPNYERIYQASNLGRVKSLKRLKEKILKPQMDSSGYYQVYLCKQSVVKHYMVHRLVWIAFNGQIPEGYEINHLDERPVNNRLENLSLVTHKENMNYGTGIERGHNQLINGKRSKPVLQFDLNNSFIKEYPSVMQAERELGFNNGNIVNCCKGKQKTAYGYKWKYAKEVN